MAYFYRVIFFVLICIGNVAHATLPMETGYEYGWTNHPNSVVQGYSRSPITACDNAWPFQISFYGGRLTGGPSVVEKVKDLAYTCQGVLDGQLRDIYNLKVRVYSECPSGSEDDGAGACVCTAGNDEFDGQCIAACPEGSERKSDGSCVRPDPCPEGKHEEFGVCVPDNCEKDETRVNGLCVKDECPEGQEKIGGVCIEKNECKAGKITGTYALNGPDDVKYICENSCVVRVRTSFDMQVDGKMYYTGNGVQTGAKCSASDNPPSSEPPGDGNPGDGDGGDGGDGGGGDGGGDGDGDGGTGPGGGGGGNNGGDGPGNGGNGPGNPDRPDPPNNADPDKPTKLPGESGVGQPVPELPEGDGSCAEGYTKVDGYCYPNKEKEPDNDGKCPQGYIKYDGRCIPMIPTGGGGGDTGGGSGDGDGDGKSGFGGSCMSGFACEGDAIQCAMAREQYSRNCKIFEAQGTAEEALYAENKDKTGKQTDDLPGNRTVDVSQSLSAQDAIIGMGGTCPAPLVVSVMGHSIEIRFDPICPILEWLGYILVAAASLASVFIVLRRI